MKFVKFLSNIKKLIYVIVSNANFIDQLLLPSSIANKIVNLVHKRRY